jgi:TolB-like protein/DNA-binding winged helix-turn-helix (wHTH) protein/Tfp pilus assembly protein PilF
LSADFHLGDCVVRPQRRLIERGGESVRVKPKSMSVLECLLAANGEPVSRNEIFDAVWPRSEVTDDTLTKCIVELRKALHDTARESRVIETIPKLGFRLVLSAEPLDEKSPTAVQSSTDSRRHHPGGWRELRPVWLLPAALLLVFGALLSFDGSRAWLTEAGITVFLKTAAALVPYGLEQEPGIAVLPFENMSGDAENEYFSDGMSAEVINVLANIHRLPVIARNSSFQFKGQNKDVKEIGRQLGVSHVLEGSVRKADNSIRVTTQLVDTATGTNVWSGVYQRELSDIFVLQNEIAKNIVDQIDLALGEKIAPLPNTMPATEVITARRTSNLEAYDLYLRGMQMLRSTNPGLIEQASGYFDAAIALDGGYADAWAAKGLALYMLGRPGYGHPHIPSSVYPAAIATYRRALEIEPGHALATGWLGVALIVNDYKWAEGMQLMKQSLARNPNDAELLSVYANHLAFMQLEGADEILYRAFRLDPFGAIPTSTRAALLLRAGRILDAAALIEISLMKDKDGYAPNFSSAVINLVIGRLDAAEERVAKARLVAHPGDLSLDSLGWVIDHRRGKNPLPPVADTLQRMKTERLSFFERRGMLVEWEDEKTIVAAFNLGIEQRHPEMRPILFGPKPPAMPDAEWSRMKEITGVTQFQSTLQ